MPETKKATTRGIIASHSCRHAWITLVMPGTLAREGSSQARNVLTFSSANRWDKEPYTGSVLRPLRSSERTFEY